MKKNFCCSDAPTPRNLPPSRAFVKIKNQFFIMKQSYFCNFDNKNEFLDPKNPHVAIFRHQTASKLELQDYFQNLGAKSLSSGKKFNCDNLKTTRGIKENFLLFFIRCNTL